MILLTHERPAGAGRGPAATAPGPKIPEGAAPSRGTPPRCFGKPGVSPGASGPVRPRPPPNPPRAGDVHPLRRVLLVHAFQVGQAHRLHLVHGQDNLFQRCARDPGGLEQTAARRPGHPSATDRSRHVRGLLCTVHYEHMLTILSRGAADLSRPRMEWASPTSPRTSISTACACGRVPAGRSSRSGGSPPTRTCGCARRGCRLRRGGSAG